MSEQLTYTGCVGSSRILIMNIAVFADLHGRILLCFKLCARWERENGEKIDLIIQAGDLGAYPDQTRLDRATIKHMRKDPTELGFSNDFTIIRDEVAEQLAKTSCPMIFVRGNHEDHAWLDEIEAKVDKAIFPVDIYQRIYCMRTGIPHTFQKNDEAITLLGIGRIGALPGETDDKKSKYIQPYELERIYDSKELEFDILLSHDVALDFLSPNYGMEEIRLILDAYTPPYHFHGHTEEPAARRIDENGKTQVIKLADLHWNKSLARLPLEVGGMGILRWKDASNHSFSLVTSDWFTEYTAKSWEAID